MENSKTQRRAPRALPSRSGSAHIANVAQVTTSSHPLGSHPAQRQPHVSPRAMTCPSMHDGPDALRQPALSAFLQEKLQRERRAESEKLTSSPSQSRAEMSASVDMGRFYHNAHDAAAGRPRSSAGLELPKKKGMGLKEMEQVMSNIHKQNFDLKLELFHRRERQTALEERVEALEAEKEKSLTVTDRLVEELDKRDKAVEEAVVMIITLEAEVDRLLSRCAVVQASETPCRFCTRGHGSVGGEAMPQTSGSKEQRADDDIAVKSITRMPSFLSDTDDKTENLRNVYLGSRAGSALSLSRVPEASSEAEGAAANSLASPTLSVLSESSFVSVYGKKDRDGGMTPSPPRYVDEPLVLDGFDAGPDMLLYQETVHPRRRAASVGRFTSIAKPPPRSRTAVPFQSLSSVMDYESPLERLMRLDPASVRSREAVDAGSDAEKWPAASAKKKKSPRARPATKEEKREALRRVLTDAPGGVRLHDHGLPPTPDTISTSTLHGFKKSDETLSQDQPRGGALLPTAEIRSSESAAGVRLGGFGSGHHRSSAHAAACAHDTRACRRQQAPGERPQSARESSGAVRQVDNDWESDSEFSDRRSLESSLDIWLRESAKPDQMVSPDLFTFPSATAPTSSPVEMLHSGSSGHAPDSRSLRHQLFPWNNGPSPPNRSSSLRAETGSTVGSTASTACGTRHRAHHRQSDDQQKTSVPPQSPPPPNGDQKRYPPMAGQQGARASLNRDDQQKTSVPPQSPPPPNGDQKRYPPMAGQQGARASLNRLLRRSLGAAPTPAHSSDNTAATDAVHNYVPMGVPSWVHRSGPPAGGDRSGVTPPPIVLSPRQAPRRPESPLEMTADSQAPEADATVKPAVVPAAASQPHQPQQEGGGPGTRKKWLPAFGRPSSSKNKGG
ncbi:hypothetical protein L249_1846 [Ophiocordyceps polyrhachis-furcata BCC 54312]|uniref:Centrosomin N-terminal motif 1 domain-containing protein n=1 Tax=Ophiocordyceps polyrhachis-furcata BCC 54312 TaxID=1330021 RepID=A0A367LSH3_9HYPO|nr:hypothetical protein L249_1846 [Ophiocordyceps polyrhachis-furcata BCC 54312]